MKYVVRLKCGDEYRYLSGVGAAAMHISGADRFNTIEEADKERSTCNYRWVQFARIVGVRSKK